MNDQTPSNCVMAVANQHEADIILYRGSIDRYGYEQVSRLCREEKERENVLLILGTPGGDAGRLTRYGWLKFSEQSRLPTLTETDCPRHLGA